jgi:hypothetical protein
VNLTSKFTTGTDTFPPPLPTTYTNSGSSGEDYYIIAYANTYPTFDFEFTVETATLTLFLDADSNFDPSNPSTDIATYVPGARLSDGVSVTLPQSLTLIAAYVNSSNGIVTPPSTDSVTFSLSDTSAFKGIAMNAPDPLDDPVSGLNAPDFRLGLLSASFGTDKTARVPLNCWDYGGFTLAHASHGSVAQAQLHIPLDANNDWIADAGWRAGNTLVADSGDDVDDVDFIVVQTTQQGDGLTRFEEYRGFVVKGQHMRTDPGIADLFITSNLPEGLGFAVNLPINVWEVWSGEIATDRAINFNYTNTGTGGNIPGHYINPLTNVPNQKALQVIDAGFNINLGVMGETHPIKLGGPRTPSNVLALEVFTQTVMWASPPTNDTTTVDAVDTEKLQQTIAHEVGHGVNFDHFDSSCPATVFTIMVTHYFDQTTVMNCPWLNIPHQYVDYVDFIPFTLK